MARTPEEIAEGKRAWRRANPGYKRAWYAANRAKACADARAWSAANPDKARATGRVYYAAHKTETLASSRAWRAANPEAKKAAQQRRRAQGYVSAQDLKNIREMSDGICAYCLQRKPLTLDHVVAITCGGTNAPDNLVMACQSCNSKKNSKPLLQLLLRGII